MNVVNLAKPMTNKVPEVILSFWLIKVLSTTVGETAADYLSVNIGLGQTITTFIMVVFFIIALVMQLAASRFVPWRYWLTVVLVSIVGTLITDILTDRLHAPLAVSTLLFSVMLAACLFIWHRMEGTISIQAIDTPRREQFYWLAVLLTFALGTAAGDYATEALQLGFTRGALIFGAAIAAIAFIYYARIAHFLLCFWCAYIFTRPLGASLGDLLTQSPTAGGLGLAALTVSAVFLIIIIALVAFTNQTAKKANVKLPRDIVTKRNIPAALTTAILAIALLGSFIWETGRTEAQAADVIANSAETLGDLSLFLKISQDTLALVDKGELLSARDRIKDLEIVWDNAEPSLKPKNPDRWHQVDKAIDQALSDLRAKRPLQANCQISLKNLVEVTKEH